MLKLQARFARAIGQSLDFPMETRTAAVEDDLFDPPANGGLRGEGPNGLRADGVGGQLVHQRVEPLVADRHFRPLVGQAEFRYYRNAAAGLL